MRLVAPISAAAAVIALCVSVHAATAQPPNILLMYVDNVGYGDLGCYGNEKVKTPRIDQLARDGARCTSFYVVTTSCTPSRGAVLTGRHPLRNGLAHQLVSTENWHGIGLPHREAILPQYLKPAGYATACFGKWNIGFAEGSRPTERGFDEFLGFRSGNISYYEHLYNQEPDMFRGTAATHVEGYSTDLFATAAIDFIDRHAKQSWFVYLPFNAAHFNSTGNMPPGRPPEWQVPARYLEQYGWRGDEPNEKRRYLAVLTALDDAVGRVLDAIDRHHLRENTLVIFISDNGAFMLPQRGLEVASNAPLRDGGTTCYEGGVRVPAIFRWPGQIPARSVVHEMLSHLDILPLCLRAARTVPGERILDGRDPLPTLSGRAPTPHPHLLFEYDKAAGLRAGDLKLVRHGPDAPWQLYDLSVDLSESQDLASERPADVARLKGTFEAERQRFRADASAPAPRPPRKQSAKKV